MNIIRSISYLTSHFGRFSDLKKCIASVFSDHYLSKIEYEHLVILDGLKYNSESIESYKSLETIYAGVQIIVSPSNSGKSDCLNRLLTYAKHDLICFLDSDDWQLLTRSKRMIEVHNIFENTVIGSNYLTGPYNLKIVHGSRYPLRDSEIRKQFIFFPFLLFSSLSIKRKPFIESKTFFNSTLRAGLDYEFYHRLMNIFECINIPDYLVYYTQNPDGITSTSQSRLSQLNTHMHTISLILMTPNIAKSESLSLSQLIINKIAYGINPSETAKRIAYKQLHSIEDDWSRSRCTEFISRLEQGSRKNLVNLIKHKLEI